MPAEYDGLLRLLSGPAHPVEMPRTAIRDNGIVEVTGSIPVGSTNHFKGLVGNG
jgi:hypothetical protein